MKKFILLFLILLSFITYTSYIKADSATSSAGVSFYLSESERGISIIDNDHIKNLEGFQLQILDNSTKTFTNIPANSGNIVKYHFNPKHQYTTTIISGPKN